MLGYVQRHAELARGLRKRMTDAEQRLWLHLRRDQLGARFYRQKPLGPYIVDFYAPKAKLVVELDGSQHNDDPAQKERDRGRDAWLNSQELQVLRFDDRQVLVETEAVVEVIFNEVRDRTSGEIPPSMTPPPNPPFSKGGEQLQALAEGSSSVPQAEEPPQPATVASPPLQKGGQGGFSGASIHDDRHDDDPNDRPTQSAKK